jgi:hypothetical protein
MVSERSRMTFAFAIVPEPHFISSAFRFYDDARIMAARTIGWCIGCSRQDSEWLHDRQGQIGSQVLD